ncbi:MAG: hypothetical protein U1F43_07530 [Myxococcota bacterium]
MVGVPVDKRVHVTRMVPPNTRDHVFLGDVNGAGAAVGNHGFDGDAATMKAHLVQFRATSSRSWWQPRTRAGNSVGQPLRRPASALRAPWQVRSEAF